MESTDRPGNVTSDDRLRGAIWGQFVGDAASLGTHWIYDLAEQKAVYPEGVRGFEAPREGHYHFGKKPGDQTHYGDGALVFLESLAAEGRFDPRAFGRKFVEFFRPGVYSGYIDHATKDTLENFDDFTRSNPVDKFDFQRGGDDDQLATASRLAALVVRYKDDPNLLELVEQTTRVCQNNDATVAYMKFNALLLAQLLDAVDVKSALAHAENAIGRVEPKFGQEIRTQVEKAKEFTAKEVKDATLAFGQACPLPQSFPSSIQTLLKHPDNFEVAILAILRAGGDSAGRAGMVGAWLGAHLGLSAIPQSWRLRLTHANRISAAVDKILADAGNQ
ncbi:MAG TPA: ADP-ribosylglycohydrolase family protein [Chthoniobacterales bacterium]|jgi:ADP-ribosylglycohydrolase|nr:ADP-ribosylglycohydrolase family protein [Chthoniobacterales bacterium]